MIKAITVPKWGLSMEEGELLSWLMAPGDKIKVGQEIAEIETTKISGPVEAQVEGTVRRLVAQEQQVLPVGALMAVVADENDSEQDIDAFVSRFQPVDSDSAGETPGQGPVSGRVAVDGLDLFYLDYQPEQEDSDKPPLLLVHGFGGDSGNWLFNAGKLAATRRVIAVDLPGHGRSSKQIADGSINGLADILRSLLDELGLSRVQLAGHSLGAAVALRLALADAGRVAGVALICPALVGKAVDPEYISAFVGARSRKQMKPLLRQLFADGMLITGDMVEDLLRYKRLDGVEAALQRIAAASLQMDEAAFIADQVASLDPPIIVIWGADDRVLLEGDTHRVIENPAAEYWIEQAGHMPHMEQYAEVNDILERHLSAP